MNVTISLDRQRQIFDQSALDQILAETVLSASSSQERRAALMAALKFVLQAGYKEIQRSFETHNQGDVAVFEHSFLIDQIIQTLHHFVTQYEFPQGARTFAENFSLIAVGGYGREELAPHSDIDLLFLLPYKTTPYTESVLEYILYFLWDLHLKVGQSTRSIDECLRHMREDHTIRTSFLDARLLVGNEALFKELQERVKNEIISQTASDFVEAKLAERDERHEKTTDSRYVLEPNIKIGKGGLRDLHTLYWIAKYLYGISEIEDLVILGILDRQTVDKFIKDQEFLLTVRCHLHYLTGRMEDRLTFDVQQEIGRRMGYTDHAGTRGVERFMKHYYLVAKDTGDLTRIFCSLFEEQNQCKPLPSGIIPAFLPKEAETDGFKLDGNRLAVVDKTAFSRHPIKIMRLFRLAQRYKLDLHPHTVSLVTQNLKRINGSVRNDPEANRLFMEMLTSSHNPEAILRCMNETGVLGRFIPDFGRVVAQMQYDMYHVYTVDEHTIRAVGILHKIEQGELIDEIPLTTAAVSQKFSRRALYLAVFLHDIAKGRGGDHSELGAQIVFKLGPRLGLDEEEIDTVAWLVLHHLNMSRTAFKRDLDDPKTITDFVALVQSPERLRLLLALTVSDIRAVGPNVWNNWKAGLLRELFLGAEDMMLEGIRTERREQRIEAARQAVKAALSDWSEEKIETFLDLGTPVYWVSFDTDSHVRHARLIDRAETKGSSLLVEARVDTERAATEVIVYTPDHPGLFSKIAGAMAMASASIVDARIVTLSNGMALDSFWVQDAGGGAFDHPVRQKRLFILIERALSGQIHTARELAHTPSNLPSRTAVFKVPPRALIDNKGSRTHTIIEVNGRDRPGLLFDVTSAMTKLGLQIASAHISTYGERVVDVFYVKDVFGLKIENEAKLKMIRADLLKVLEKPLA